MRAACMQKPRRMPGLRGGPARDRTLDPMIKSHLLYQLSYRTIFQVGCDQPGRKCRSEISKLCIVFRGSASRPWPLASGRAVAGAACSSAFAPACAKCLSPGGGMTKAPAFAGAFGDPAGARTQDPYIKSVMLYQLSYRIGRHRGRPDFEAAKVTAAPACTSTRPIITPQRRTTCTGSGLARLAASFSDDGQPLEGLAAVEQVPVGGQRPVVCGTKVLAHL